MTKRLILVAVIVSFHFSILGCTAFYYVLESGVDSGRELEMLKKTNNWIGIIPGSVVEIKLVSNDKLYGNLMSADSLGLILEMDNENVEISKSEISEINVISKKSDRRKAVIAGILMDLCIVVNFIMMSMGGP